jgi:hypothetical protein
MTKTTFEYKLRDHVLQKARKKGRKPDAMQTRLVVKQVSKMMAIWDALEKHREVSMMVHLQSSPRQCGLFNCKIGTAPVKARMQQRSAHHWQMSRLASGSTLLRSGCKITSWNGVIFWRDASSRAWSGRSACRAGVPPGRAPLRRLRPIGRRHQCRKHVVQSVGQPLARGASVVLHYGGTEPSIRILYLWRDF